MLYAISSSDRLNSSCDFEIVFTKNEKRKITAMVFVRDISNKAQICKTFVGHLPLDEALEACDLPDDFKTKVHNEKNQSAYVYRSSLPLSYANRRKYKLKLDLSENNAVILIAHFNRSVFLNEAAAKRKPEYYGGFSIVNLKRGEVMQIDDRYVIFTGETIRMAFDCEFEDVKFVDCSSILHQSALTSVPVTLF